MEAGQPLRQEELSEKLGYSRMPVREALQILEEQGLVRRLATRHVVVADFSERNIEEIFDMFGNVEKKALKDLAEMSFEWVYSAEGEDAEEKFHEICLWNDHKRTFPQAFRDIGRLLYPFCIGRDRNGKRSGAETAQTE